MSKKRGDYAAVVEVEGGVTIHGNVNVQVGVIGQRKKIHNFPDCSIYFHGREEILNRAQMAIHNCLHDDTGHARIVTIVGFGGMGKSEIAKVLAVKLQSEFDLIFWFDAHSRLALQNDFRYLAGMLKIPFDDEFGGSPLPPSNIAHIYNRISTEFTNAMFIFDNAEDMKSKASVFGIEEYMMPNFDCKMPVFLVTSRKDLKSAHLRIECIHLGPLTNEESYKCLLKYLKIKHTVLPPSLERVIKTLVENVDGYPLGISLLGGTVASNAEAISLDKSPLKSYMDILLGHCFEELSGQRRCEAIVEKITHSTIENLERMSPKQSQTAMEILSIIAQLSPNSVYVGLVEGIYLEKTFVHHEIFCPRFVWDDLEMILTRGLNILMRHSLIQVQHKSYYDYNGNLREYDTLKVHLPVLKAIQRHFACRDSHMHALLRIFKFFDQHYERWENEEEFQGHKCSALKSAMEENTMLRMEISSLLMLSAQLSAEDSDLFQRLQTSLTTKELSLDEKTTVGLLQGLLRSEGQVDTKEKAGPTAESTQENLYSVLSQRREKWHKLKDSMLSLSTEFARQHWVIELCTKLLHYIARNIPEEENDVKFSDWLINNYMQSEEVNARYCEVLYYVRLCDSNRDWSTDEEFIRKVFICTSERQRGGFWEDMITTVRGLGYDTGKNLLAHLIPKHGTNLFKASLRLSNSRLKCYFLEAWSDHFCDCMLESMKNPELKALMVGSRETIDALWDITSFSLEHLSSSYEERVLSTAATELRERGLFAILMTWCCMFQHDTSLYESFGANVDTGVEKWLASRSQGEGISRNFSIIMSMVPAADEFLTSRVCKERSKTWIRKILNKPFNNEINLKITGLPEIPQELIDIPERLRNRMLSLQMSSSPNLHQALTQEGTIDDGFTHPEALNLQERESMHLESLRKKSHSAGVLRSQGKHEEFIRLNEELLSESTVKLGRSHEKTLEITKTLAKECCDQGNYDRAAALYERFLKSITSKPGAKNLQTFEEKQGLAYACFMQGKHGRAVDLYRELLQGRSGTLQSTHPDLIKARKGLALALVAQFKYRDTMKLYEDLLQDYKFVFGHEHPGTLDIKLRLAAVYTEMGDFDLAVNLVMETKSQQVAMLGPEDPSLVQTTGILANIYQLQGKYEESIEAYTKNLEIQKNKLGPQAMETMGTMNCLALALHDSNKYGDAIAIFQNLLQMQQNLLGPSHQKVFATKYNLGLAIQSDGDNENALAIFENLYEEQLKVHGHVHQDTRSASNAFIICLQENGQYDRVIHIYEGLLYEQEKVFGCDSEKVMETKRNLDLIMKACADFNISVTTEIVSTPVTSRTGDNLRFEEQLGVDILVDCEPCFEHTPTESDAQQSFGCPPPPVEYMLENRQKLHHFPPSCPNYCARDDKMQEILDAIKYSSTEGDAHCRVVVIAGYGGMGKSEITKAVLRSCQGEYDCILWLNAGTEDMLRTGFHQVMEAMELPVSPSSLIADIYSAVQKGYKNAVIVFDGVDQLQPSDDVFPFRKYFPPPSPNFVFILTSRTKNMRLSNVRDYTQTTTIGGMTQDESIVFLKNGFALSNQSLPPSLQQSLQSLAKVLEGYPVNLCAAVKSIVGKREVIDPVELESRIKYHMKALLKVTSERRSLIRGEVNMQKIFSSTIEQLLSQPSGNHAFDLLKILSFMRSSKSSVALIISIFFGVQYNPQASHKLSWGSELDDAHMGFCLLDRYCLVTLEGDKISLSRQLLMRVRTKSYLEGVAKRTFMKIFRFFDRNDHNAQLIPQMISGFDLLARNASDEESCYYPVMLFWKITLETPKCNLNRLQKVRLLLKRSSWSPDEATMIHLAELYASILQIEEPLSETAVTECDVVFTNAARIILCLSENFSRKRWVIRSCASVLVALMTKLGPENEANLRNELGHNLSNWLRKNLTKCTSKEWRCCGVLRVLFGLTSSVNRQQSNDYQFLLDFLKNRNLFERHVFWEEMMEAVKSSTDGDDRMLLLTNLLVDTPCSLYAESLKFIRELDKTRFFENCENFLHCASLTMEHNAFWTNLEPTGFFGALADVFDVALPVPKEKYGEKGRMIGLIISIWVRMINYSSSIGAHLFEKLDKAVEDIFRAMKNFPVSASFAESAEFIDFLYCTTSYLVNSTYKSARRDSIFARLIAIWCHLFIVDVKLYKRQKKIFQDSIESWIEESIQSANKTRKMSRICCSIDESHALEEFLDTRPFPDKSVKWASVLLLHLKPAFPERTTLTEQWRTESEPQGRVTTVPTTGPDTIRGIVCNPGLIVKNQTNVRMKVNPGPINTASVIVKSNGEANVQDVMVNKADQGNEEAMKAFDKNPFFQN